MFVEDCESIHYSVAQTSIDVVHPHQQRGQRLRIRGAGGDQRQHEESVADETDRAGGIDDSESHVVLLQW